MGARNHNYRLVKIHRTYTVEEMATLLGVHRNTVRRWFDEGLATIDQRRPVLVKGDALLTFLKDRRTKGKRPCRPGEIYCLRCRAPRRPAGSRVVYQPFTFDRGNLLGTCPACGASLNRRVSLARMGTAIGDLQVAFPQAHEHIDESPDTSLNCDLNKVARSHV
jgi:excisionase family DNA binding protein